MIPNFKTTNKRVNFLHALRGPYTSILGIYLYAVMIESDDFVQVLIYRDISKHFRNFEKKMVRLGIFEYEIFIEIVAVETFDEQINVCRNTKCFEKCLIFGEEN